MPLPGSSSGRRGEDGYVLWSEMEAAVRERMGVDGEGETVAREFLDMLRRQPEGVTVNAGALSRGTLQRALEAGFVTLPLARVADGTEQEYPLTMPSLGPLMRCLAAASERVVEIIQRHGVAHAGPSSSVVMPLPLLRERYDPLLRNPQASAELIADAEGAAGRFVAGGGDGGAGRQSKVGGGHARGRSAGSRVGEWESRLRWRSYWGGTREGGRRRCGWGAAVVVVIVG
ncbi:hypothetical protein BDZ91DRAFT_798029 [Kalaharituber pfeilii]|nr:hypothetical protein BDZ91DRAFT_798029 [Kalaharituber pfeilii]